MHALPETQMTGRAPPAALQPSGTADRPAVLRRAGERAPTERIDFEDVLVVPFQELLARVIAGGADHKGGPVWPDFEAAGPARFHRGGEPVDTRPDPRPAARTDAGRDAFWIGPVVPHFGHGIADFSTRIAGTLAAAPEARLVFAPPPGETVAGPGDCPDWFREMLAWFGVTPDRLVFVNEPTLFRRLAVVAQGEQVGAIPPDPAYLDILDRVAAARPVERPPIPVLYVSRAEVSGHVAGEAHIEEAMAAAGATVLKPETVPLAEQLDLYRSAERIVFAEGSAIHGLQLLGRGLGAVDVICRRRGWRFGRALIPPRARSARWHDVVVADLHFRTPAGLPAMALSLPFLEADALLESLAATGLPLRETFRADAFAAAVEADIRAWLAAAVSEGRILDREVAATILRQLEAAGHGDLLETARTILAGAPAGRG